MSITDSMMWFWYLEVLAFTTHLWPFNYGGNYKARPPSYKLVYTPINYSHIPIFPINST